MYIWLFCILDIAVCLTILTFFSQPVTKKKKMEVRHSEHMFKSHQAKTSLVSCDIQSDWNESTWFSKPLKDF